MYFIFLFCDDNGISGTQQIFIFSVQETPEIIQEQYRCSWKSKKKNPYRCRFAVVLTAAKASSKIPALLLECA